MVTFLRQCIKPTQEKTKHKHVKYQHEKHWSVPPLTH